MRAREEAPPRSGCPIHLALRILGDPWTLLVVRDLMFKGRDTFTAFLEAEEGIASNVLADRLRRLEAAGLVARRPDPDDARRQRYSLTDAGFALAPLMVEIVVWSADHLDTDAPPEVVEAMRTDRDAFLANLRRARESG